MKVLSLIIVATFYVNSNAGLIGHYSLNGRQISSDNTLVQDSKPFRYIIFKDRGNAKKRSLALLAEETVFSEERLAELSKLLVKRYISTKRLDVLVYSSLNQIRTPEEENIPYTSENPNYVFYEYPFANIAIDEINITVKYTVINGKKFYWKVLQLKR